MKRKPSMQAIARSVQSGQLAVLTIFFIVFFLGVAGLAVDVGELWNTKRKMQTAADAAAIAGVNDLAVQDTTDVTADADIAAAKNGFRNGQSTSFSANAVTVTVNNPPPSAVASPYGGNSNAVQVTISQDQPTQFLKLAGFSTIPVSVSGLGMTTTGGSCVYSLDPSGSGAFTIGGTSSINSACGLYVDSNNSSAAIASGGGTLSAPRLGVVGGTTINGGGTVPISTSIPAFGDPLSYIPAPTVPTCPSYNTVNLSGAQSPGEYCGGFKVNAGNTVTFSPGLYIVNGGGITIGAGATVTGNGVTFYLTGSGSSGDAKKAYGGVTIDGTATVQLSAPNTCGTGTAASGGSINGMLFFQDRSITQTASNASTINGSASSYFNGALYFPTTTLNYAGSSGTNGYTYIVAYDLKVTGNATISNNYSCLNGVSLIQNASLVM